MFHIPLEPPDYKDPAFIQRHLVFAAIWARLLGTELSVQTRGVCSGFIRPYPFPDLRASIVIHGSSSNIDAEKTLCARALRNILVSWQPSLESVNQSARVEAQNILTGREYAVGNSFFNASHILLSVLPLIYQESTLLHSLATIDPERYRSLAVDDFTAWLRSQRSSGRYGIISISHCLPEGDFERAAEETAIHNLRNLSEIAAPGKIKLPRDDNGPIAKSPLRRLVVIGNANEPSNIQISSPAVIKYCERQHSITLDDASMPPRVKAVRIKCVRESVYDLDTWIALFCEPQDCPSTQEQEVAATAIASDPDTLMHAQGNLPYGRGRGPYLIEINPAGE
jgi:hypothetical protein